MKELAPTDNELIQWGLKEVIQRERVKDQLMENELETEKSDAEVINMFASMNDLNTQESFNQYCKKQGLQEEALLLTAKRSVKWFELCEKKFKHKAATLFLKKKASLDKVSYSLLFFEDEALAAEMFVRIKEGECSIDDALRQSSTGPVGLKTGRVSPVALGDMPAGLAEIMRVSQPGQLWPPKAIEGGWVIVRHEKLWPAVFNRYERIHLLLELGDNWIAEQQMPLEKNNSTK